MKPMSTNESFTNPAAETFQLHEQIIIELKHTLFLVLK